jgi:hypothetical protein
MGELRSVITRSQMLDANDWLDAMDEAQAAIHRRAAAERKRR